MTKYLPAALEITDPSSTSSGGGAMMEWDDDVSHGEDSSWNFDLGPLVIQEQEAPPASVTLAAVAPLPNQDQVDRHAARMEKVRQRLAQKEQEAILLQQQEREQGLSLEMSTEARRQRAFDWYKKYGGCCISKKDYMKRLQKEQQSSKTTSSYVDIPVQSEDVDLLPWNFNGTMVNMSKLSDLGVKQF